MSLSGGGEGTVLKAPFPRVSYMGGKARVADLTWSRLGNVDNFVEPFAGSLAVLLRRPADHFAGGYRVETVNDLNHYVVNVWRAIANAPDEVAFWSDNPVTEADLHARHKWLVRSEEAKEWREQMRTNPEHFDAKIAGWWIWGACAWIGGAWCSHKVDQNNMPLLDPSQKGVLSGWNESPADWEQVPDLDPGRGDTAPGGRPQLTDQFDIGRGVNSSGWLPQQLPRMGARFGQMDAPGVLNPTHGTCAARRAWLTDWMRRLADRLRLVRTCYGHWSRICDSDSTLTRLGTTGVFLDPPYPAERADNGKKSRDANLYATDKGSDLNALRDEVLAWCRKWGQDKQIRVVVCGYDSDGYAPLLDEGWQVVAWEASGGYGNQRRKGKGKSENAARERLYISPHCVTAEKSRGLFDDVPYEAA